MPFAWIDSCPRLTSDDALAALRKIVAETQREMQERFDLPLALIIVDALMPAGGIQGRRQVGGGPKRHGCFGENRARGPASRARDRSFGKDVLTGTRNSSVKEDAVEAVLALIADGDLAGTVTNQRLAIRKLKGGPQL